MWLWVARGNIQQISNMNEFRCYEPKIEESEKSWQSPGVEPGHLWFEPPVPEVSWVQLPATAGFFRFPLYFAS